MGSPGIGASSGEPGGMLTGSCFPGKPGGGGSGPTGSGVGAGTSGWGSEGEGVPSIRTDPFVSRSAATGRLSLIERRRAAVHGSFRQYRPHPGRLEFSSHCGDPGKSRLVLPQSGRRVNQCAGSGFPGGQHQQEASGLGHHGLSPAWTALARQRTPPAGRILSEAAADGASSGSAMPYGFPSAFGAVDHSVSSARAGARA
jgi:hypothetical protein